MMSEFVNPQRDMSRADWQRELGAVIFRITGDQLFAAGPIRTPDMTSVDLWARRTEEEKGVDAFWYRAHSAVLSALLPRAFTAAEAMPSEIDDSIKSHTFRGIVPRVVSEAVDAQVHFPLNLAQLVSVTASRRGIDGFTVDSYSDVADLIDRTDVQTIINQALLTRNGMWEDLSSQSGISRDFLDPLDHSPASYEARIIEKSLRFQQGSVCINEELQQTLLTELRKVNANGSSDPSEDTSRLTTSGCPARHHRIHHATVKRWPLELNALAAASNTPISELTATRETSVVEDGLRFMADYLRDFEAYTSGVKTTYSSSVR